MTALVQQTDEWLQLRKSKIGASDAPVIMGESPWKTRLQLWEEKLSYSVPTEKTAHMQRGLDLEETARELFTIKTGISVSPKVLFHSENEWMMASLDGISECGKFVVEIKCPNIKDHTLALEGKVPDHYYAQLQHQMEVCDVNQMYYFSFDGYDGVPIVVKKDQGYIERLIEEEKKFYQSMISKQPPEPHQNEFKERSDDLWKFYASEWISISTQTKNLEKKKEEIKEQLILLSGKSNSKGAGIRLYQIQRKGVVEYQKIPELANVDLEKFRKPSINSWGINIE